MEYVHRDSIGGPAGNVDVSLILMNMTYEREQAIREAQRVIIAMLRARMGCRLNPNGKCRIEDTQSNLD